MTEEQREAIEALGWGITEWEDGYYEFQQYSPAGEDFSFSVSAANMADEISAYYEGFDAEEHAAMWVRAKWNGAKDVPSLRVLLDDAVAIEDMLRELAIAVKQAG